MKTKKKLIKQMFILVPYDKYPLGYHAYIGNLVIREIADDTFKILGLDVKSFVPISSQRPK